MAPALEYRETKKAKNKIFDPIMVYNSDEPFL
jgi:hypothetical protein